MLKPFIIFLFTSAFLFSVHCYGQDGGSGNHQSKYVLVIHGGAGDPYGEMPADLRKAYDEALRRALSAGESILSNGGSSLDAVEQAIRVMEDDPHFNAGRGAVLNAEGHVEMDASIMSGKDLSCGAVASVRTVKNPVSLARLVMEKTNHVLLVADGAEKFAISQNAERRDSSYFTVPGQLEEWMRMKSKKGTVGAVALDKQGNLAAATSTGGLAGKMPGRVGDSPLINAGTYASNGSCAVSCTGIGEKFIKNTVAFNISALMQYKGLSLRAAVQEMLFGRLQKGDGGIIAVDKDGNYEMSFNTKVMFRAVATSGGVKAVYTGGKE